MTLYPGSIEWAKEIMQAVVDAGLADGSAVRKGRTIYFSDKCPGSYRIIAWKALHRLKGRVKYELRQERLKSLPSRFNRSDWEKCKEFWNNACAYCGRTSQKLVRDHFIPIAHPDSPGTVPWNIVPACPSCNSSKSESDPSGWYADERRRLIIKRDGREGLRLAKGIRAIRRFLSQVKKERDGG